eukprot:CAMPEP_0115159656 /NCGR_PEP_ID=MMETSP0227-20121206/70355_1 /TAXON_ID=89957 /ORGANISM="Polarella glacialis, Strain CCMP 1383" /LENGTH=219 /DNA_ID=CAMNT_0002571435 /DNA_START=188 /DNA_END=847 /DNA_ORIENTATION=+
MYLCVPLRLGVFAFALVTFLSSLLFTLHHKMHVDLFRNFVGGFALASRIAVGTGEVSGVLFALLGTLGAWYGRRDWVFTYNVWQHFRWATFAYMFYVDVPLLSKCEEWVNNLQTASDKYGYNEGLYDIAMHGQCEATRTSFFTLSALTVLLLMYSIHSTNRFLYYAGKLPDHLLHLPKDVSSGAFYSHSLGERSKLNKLWGKHDHHGIGQQPVGTPMNV